MEFRLALYCEMCASASARVVCIGIWFILCSIERKNQNSTRLFLFLFLLQVSNAHTALLNCRKTYSVPRFTFNARKCQYFRAVFSSLSLDRFYFNRHYSVGAHYGLFASDRQSLSIDNYTHCFYPRHTKWDKVLLTRSLALSFPSRATKHVSQHSFREKKCVHICLISWHSMSVS